MTTIVDLATHGNLKSRDTYARSANFAVKGSGSAPVSIDTKYYGIQSASSTSYQLAGLNATESAADSGIASLSLKVHDGTTLNTVLDLNNTTSTLKAATIALANDSTYKTTWSKSGSTIEQTFTNAGTAVKIIASSAALSLDAANLTVTGALHSSTGTIWKDNLAHAAKIQLNDHATAANMVFSLGDFTGTPVAPLTLTEAGADVVGVLTVGGTDVMSLMTSSNYWGLTGSTIYTKADYNTVQVNVANAYTTNKALDVNGSATIRGNKINVYDATGLADLNAMYFDNTNNDLYLRTSLATQGSNTDNLIFSTTSGANNTYLDRVNIGGGAGVQPVTFSNCNVGVGGAPSGTYKFEVTGTEFISSNLTVGGNIDMTSGNITDVVNLQNFTLAEGAKMTLTTHATVPQFDFYLGDLAGSPSDVLTLTKTMATLTTPMTISGGDLNMSAADIKNVHDVYNASAALGAKITLTSHATAPTFDFLLGDLAGSPTNVLSMTASHLTASQNATFTHDLTTNGNLTVDLTSTLTGDVTTSILKNDNTGNSLGGSHVTLGTNTNGLSVRVVETNEATLASVTPQLQVLAGSVEFNKDINMNAKNINEIASILNDNAASDGTKLTFVSGATSKLDVIVGDLSATPTTAMSVYKDKIDITVPLNVTTGNATFSHDVIVSGDLVVNGTTTTINSTTVTVDDIAIDLGNNATTNASINSGGIILGQGISDSTPPSILYDSTHKTWDSNIDVNVASGKALRVNDSDAVIDASGLSFGNTTAGIFLGASKQWKLVFTVDSGEDVLHFMHDDGSGYVSKFSIGSS
jgi:hypothetical protein